MVEEKNKTVIVIPVYNGEKMLGRSIEGCTQQTKSADIWIIDNASTDATASIAKDYVNKHKNIRFFQNESNLGRVANWNKGLDLFEQSTHRYIKFLFAGDELLPHCIEEVEQTFARDDMIGAVAFPYEFIGKNGSKTISSHDEYADRIIDIPEINRINLEEGGLLGAIVCNAYNKKFIKGYRFSEFFVGKADFDYEILSRSKAYYIGKVLARFNLDAHNTFFKARNYSVEFEYAFNRAYRLEKVKRLFSEQEYKRIKEKILLETVSRNFPYYGKKTLLKLCFSILTQLMKKSSETVKDKLQSMLE